jgi:predicted transcriptional regulator of viral defense system
MWMQIMEEIETIFKAHGGVMQTKELRDSGIYYKKLQQLIAEGQVQQIRRGYYQYIDENAFSEAPLIAKLFPDGVVCMESALEYYGYTDRTPSAWNIAVRADSARMRFKIAYPVVKPHFIEPSRFIIGITHVLMEENDIKIYDRDRTICDCLLHRNKMDAEVFNSAVQSYLKDSGRNEAHLALYAKKLHVEKKVKEVLGIWL